MKTKFEVIENITRYKIVELDVPDSLKADEREEWITEHVYKEASSDSDWEILNTHETNWEEA